jgi:5-methylcytosine-specific restriction endonuclease McrA
MKDRGTQVYCSSRCYQAQYRKDHPEKFPAWDDAKKAAYHRRRARKRGAQTTKVVPIEVFERDQWICGLCGESVDRTLAYPDPHSASLDHRIPLSRGGSHDLENVQLAHLRCNIAKGNRILAP